jgi:phosphoinositide-3-kinase regulatory subunit 4
VVRRITALDADFFPEYILPNLARFSKDPETTVRALWASSIASVAESALRFLELGQVRKTVRKNESSQPDSRCSF